MTVNAAKVANKATVNGLSPGTEYEFQVQAENNVGVGPVCSELVKTGGTCTFWV